jgi:uncharacterized protein
MEETVPPDPIPPLLEAPQVVDVQAVAVPSAAPPSESDPEHLAEAAVTAEPPPLAEPPLPPPILPERRPMVRTWKQHVWAVLCHLMLFLAIPTVFLGGVITFFLWQIKGRDDPQVEDQGREALNFQINVAVVTALLGITIAGLALVPIVWLVAGIFCVIAARKASEGANYRYPWIWRVVTH